MSGLKRNARRRTESPAKPLRHGRSTAASLARKSAPLMQAPLAAVLMLPLINGTLRPARASLIKPQKNWHPMTLKSQSLCYSSSLDVPAPQRAHQLHCPHPPGRQHAPLIAASMRGFRPDQRQQWPWHARGGSATGEVPAGGQETAALTCRVGPAGDSLHYCPPWVLPEAAVFVPLVVRQVQQLPRWSTTSPLVNNCPAGRAAGSTTAPLVVRQVQQLQR